MKDKQQSYFVNIGSSSLLVIFLVLCLATFAILSLSSARSDYSFSERLAVHKQEYYESSARAETIVGEIDTVLCGIAEEIDSSGLNDSGNTGNASDVYSAYLADVGGKLDGKEIEGISIRLEQSKQECIISFRVPAGEQQELSVMLQVTDYREHENYYEIKAWEVVNVDNWEGGRPLELMPVIE